MHKPGFIRIAFAAAALLAASLVGARAAFTLPPELEHASDQEKLRYIQQTGERSINDKILIGRQRYQQRLALRRSLVGAMQDNFEQRRKVESFQAAPSLVDDHEKSGTQMWILSLAALALVGLFAYRYHRGERAEA